MSKDYVMQLEATIQNLRRDNSILKEENAKYKLLEEQIGCPLEVLNYKEVNYIRDNEQSYGSVLGINLQRKTIMIGTMWSFTEKPLNQFGRTWWLKEDKVNKEDH